MNQQHRTLLLKHRLALIQDIEVSDLIQQLFQNRIISENDKERISSGKTRRERSETLLDLLPRKGPKAFKGFVDVLEHRPGYQHLSKLLQGAETRAADSGFDCVDARVDGLLPPLQALPLRPRSSSKREPDFSDAYPMNHVPRGWCMIINNVNFWSLSDRPGSSKDAANLQSLFQALDFRVWTLTNLEADAIREKVLELSEKDHSACDALVVCLLSHGLSGHIYGVDGGLVGVSEIVSVLSTGPSGKALAGKPKLFLIQACRSLSKQDMAAKNGAPDSIASSELVLHPDPVHKLDEHVARLVRNATDAFIQQGREPFQADTLLGYSTFPGEVSWRHTEHGSFFVDAVVEVFQEHASWMDVLEMLVMVNKKVYDKVARFGETQIPAPVFTLLKKLYLVSPKL